MKNYLEKRSISLWDTYSVYNTSVKFNKLGLIIIDEQHKFGVKQKESNLLKNQ